MVEADGKLQLTFGPEILVLPRGLQPSLLRTKSGALIVQAQIPEKSLPSKRMAYPYAVETRVSRDDGRTWTQSTVAVRAFGGLGQLSSENSNPTALVPLLLFRSTVALSSAVKKRKLLRHGN